MTKLYSIRVNDNRLTQSDFNLLPVIAMVVPVKFTFGGNNNDHCAGEILVCEEKQSVVGERKSSTSSLSIPPRSTSSGNAALEQIEVQFSADLEVPFPFRGRLLKTSVEGNIKPLLPGQAERVLASTKHGPVWTVSMEGVVKNFRSSFALPVIPPEGNLRDVLNGDRFLEVLPLMHFIHEVCAESLYEGPPLRACFMFDDPNLHWTSYGYVNYRRVVEQAKKEHYHVSFATVPLDNWFTHSTTATLFREHSKQLSMLVHGNNHTHQELLQDLSEPGREGLLWQSLHRIVHLEKSAGFEVSRVMAAPHGACSDAMMESLVRCGFESATISHGSLRVHNKGREWTRTLGYLPSETIRGCPVLPRWRLAANATNTILLAAYLRQPIILVGHHQDLKNGTDVLDQLARFINSLGAVSWGDMAELSRNNYYQRVDGDTLKIKPMGRKVSVQLPQSVKYIAVENPFPLSWAGWNLISGKTVIGKVRPGEARSLSGVADGRISIEVETKLSEPPSNISIRRSPSALIRRLATEARDRLRPLVNR